MQRREFVAGAVAAASCGLLPLQAAAQTKAALERPVFSADPKATTDVTMAFMKQIFEYSLAQHTEACDPRNFTTFDGDDKLTKFWNFLREPHAPAHIRMVGAAGHGSVQRMQSCLQYYYTRGFVDAYSLLIDLLLRSKFKSDVLKLKRNAEWFKERAPVWEGRLKKLDEAYVRAVKETLPKLHERSIRRYWDDASLRKAMRARPYGTDQGKFILQLDEVLKESGLAPVMSASWSNGFGILQRYSEKGSKDVIERISKSIYAMEDVHGKALKQYETVTAVIRKTPTAHYETIDKIMYCDAETLGNIKLLIEDAKVLIKDYQKGGKYYRLIHNDPNYCPNALTGMAYQIVGSDKIPNFAASRVFMQRSLKAEMERWNDKLDKYWREVRSWDENRRP